MVFPIIEQRSGNERLYSPATKTQRRPVRSAPERWWVEAEDVLLYTLRIRVDQACASQPENRPSDRPPWVQKRRLGQVAFAL
jgi:hypothetical protein